MQFSDRFKTNAKRVLTASALMMVAGASFAQAAAVDVSAATDSLAAVKTAVNEVGPDMLSAVGAGIVFKWVLAFII